MGMIYVAICLMGLLAVSLAQLPIGMVYSDINQGGTAYPVYGSIPDLSGTPIGIDSISSMYFTTPGYYVRVYTGIGYTGNIKIFRTPFTVPSLLSMPGWNDAIRSITIVLSLPGTPGLYLCSDYYLGGNCEFFYQGSYANLNTSIGIDTASSARVFAGTRARLYSDINYGPSVGSPFFEADITLSAGDAVYDILTDNDEAASLIVDEWPQPTTAPSK